MPRRSTGRLLVCAAWCLLPGCDDAPMMAGEDALAPIDARLPVDADPPDASEADAAVAPDAALGDAPCAADLDFFATRVRPILAIDCADCHLRGGSAPAVGARLALSVPTDLVADFRLLRALAAETVDGESRLRLKPLGELEHGGGPRFAVGDPADVVFVELIARFTDPTCETPPPAPRPAPPAPLRRLTAIEYARTVRDLFPGVAMPALPLADAPADHGFENDVNAQAPSARLVEQYQQAAFAVAEAVAPHFARLSPCLFVEADCPARFIATLGRRVFRRPLDAAETQRYATFWQAQAADSGHTVAARLTLQAMLQAPAFLYRPEWGAPPVEEGAVGLTGPELATRLSYFLWGSAPDAMLDALADDGRLLDPTVLSEQVDRLLADPRAREQAVDFARQWLRADRLGAVNKDPLIYPEFNDDLRAAMRTEVDLFFAHIVFDRAGSVAALLTDATSFVTPALATLYGLEAPAVPVARVALPPEQRAGLLTRAGFLAAHGHFEHPSPVLRGVFVLERLLCAAPPPPMANVDTTPPAPEGFDYPTTNRERYARNADREPCATCHHAIDGIGFAFERYDSLGRWRDFDNGLRVDASGRVETAEGTWRVDGPVELSAALAASAQVADCFARQVYRFAHGRPEAEGDLPALDELQAGFAPDIAVLALMRAVALDPDFARRPAPEAP